MKKKIDFKNYFKERKRYSNENKRWKRDDRKPPVYRRTMVRKRFPKRIATALGMKRNCAFYVSMDSEVIYISQSHKIKTRYIYLEATPCYSS